MTDKKQIGPTRENREVLAQLMETGCFAEQQDAAKFAMSLAVVRGATATEARGTDTAWAGSQFDDTGEVRALLDALVPNGEPYRTAEALLNEGLRIIGAEHQGRRLDLLALIHAEVT
jgi:hypothetical protein